MSRESNGVTPAMSEQISFWDEWNLKYRNTSLPQDEYNAKQLAYARNLILKRGNIRTVLEVGCGTGWLSTGIDDLAAVTGTDLSPGAIQEARNRQSRATFLSGDILDLHLDSRFDMVISTDTMAHIPDHSAFITKLASLLNPGGILLLMTQNPFVWYRTSWLSPVSTGQYRNWPRVDELRRLRKPQFRIETVTSIVPQGDLGMMRLLNSRYCAGILRRLIGPRAQEALFERLLLGKELIIIAHLKKPKDSG